MIADRMTKMEVPPMDMHAWIRDIIVRMHEVYLGQDEVLKCVLCALLSGGHVLLEGVPGVGKTLIAITLAKLLHLSFKRIQFTNDMLPSDVTGFHTFRSGSSSLDIVKGPIFASIVLADEINRTSPKTQSALLEAMEEAQVTIDGITYILPEPFRSLPRRIPQRWWDLPPPGEPARPLPPQGEGGVSPLEEETEILRKDIDHADALKLKGSWGTTTSVPHQGDLRSEDPSGRAGLFARIVRSTRAHPAIELGCHPRGSRPEEGIPGVGFIQGRDFVTPGDVQSMAPFVLEHRIIAKNGAPHGALENILHEVPLPPMTSSDC
jgi:MoxR-like ATPase